MQIPYGALIVSFLFGIVALLVSWGPLLGRMWARKHGYRFVKGMLGEFLMEYLDEFDGPSAYYFVVENDKGRWRTAATNGISVWWADEPKGVTTLGLSEHGWREPDDD